MTGSGRRIKWVTRQLVAAPDEVLVDVSFSGRAENTCERLGRVRDSVATLLTSRDSEVSGFALSLVSSMGTKRSGERNAFVPSVVNALDTFYEQVAAAMKPWAGQMGEDEG